MSVESERAASAGRLARLSYGVILASLLISLTGYELFKTINTFEHRTISHVGDAIEVFRTIDKPPPDRLLSTVLQPQLEALRTHPAWCAETMRYGPARLLNMLSSDKAIALCAMALPLADNAIDAARAYEAGLIGKTEFLARVTAATKGVVELMTEYHPIADRAHDSMLVFVRTVSIVGAILLAMGAGRSARMLGRSIERMHAAMRQTENARQLADEAQQRLRAAIDASADGFALLDTEGTLQLCNGAFAENLSGGETGTVVGKTLNAVLRNGIATTRYVLGEGTPPAEWVDQTVRALTVMLQPVELLLTDGRQLRLRGYRMESGDLVLQVFDQTEVMRRKRLQERYAKALEAANREIERKALHDALTGLPNRRFLDRRLKELEVSTRGSDAEATLVRVDLDHFKYVNDALGHAAGDHVLAHVARVLTEEVRSNELAARVGGDEFVIVPSIGADPGSVQKLVERIQARLSEPLQFEGKVCRFGASFGIASTRIGSHSMTELLSFADAALYRAKEAGRNRIEFYTPQLHQGMVQNRLLADRIRAGLERSEFVPFFQPQVDAKTLDVTGVEVLARWQHPKMGLLMPDDFLNVAEQVNVVPEIDKMMFEKAFEICEQLRCEGLPLPRISFNVSSGRVNDPRILDSVTRMRDGDTEVAFELLESIFLEEESTTFAYHLDRVREAGISIEIDDFGSGRASIVGLMQIAPSRLKIDRRLILPITQSESARRLLRAIIEIGEALGISVTAEGVETMEHARLLRDIGCDTLQGYAFSPPINADALRAYLRQQQGTERKIASA